MIREQTVVFVWRCPDCPGLYDGEGLLFLYADEDYGYCTCGGRLVEGVAPEGERRCRPVIPERLKGTSLHRQLERLLAGEEDLGVTTSGYREDRRIDLFGYVG
ncbi:MAG: hypothetical protein M3N18_03770 [Actinomycetota bacterium]|nr:hypothetical protein [Actinomycetota bacterium]